MNTTTRKVVIAGVMGAISIFLGATHLGFIPWLAGAALTIMHVPVIIGAILEGPWVGLAIGFLFGAFSLLQGAIAPTGPTDVWFTNPLISIVPRLFIGPVAWLAYKALKGLNEKDLERVYNRIELTPGATTLIPILKKLGYKIAVISGGFTFVAERLKQKLGLDYAYANTLEIHQGILTGQVLPPFIDAQRKADLLEVIAQQEKIELDQVIAVGDGANDILMLEKAGLGIAFNAKPIVREKADLALSQKNMKSILYLLGLTEREVSEAMSK